MRVIRSKYFVPFGIGQVLPVTAHQLGEPGDHRDRGAQVMRDHADEVVLELVELLLPRQRSFELELCRHLPRQRPECRPPVAVELARKAVDHAERPEREPFVDLERGPGVEPDQSGTDRWKAGEPAVRLRVGHDEQVAVRDAVVVEALHPERGISVCSMPNRDLKKRRSRSTRLTSAIGASQSSAASQTSWSKSSSGALSSTS